MKILICATEKMLLTESSNLIMSILSEDDFRQGKKSQRSQRNILMRVQNLITHTEAIRNTQTTQLATSRIYAMSTLMILSSWV